MKNKIKSLTETRMAYQGSCAGKYEQQDTRAKHKHITSNKQSPSDW